MRITRDQWAIRLALVTAQRSTCLRRAVGCILLDKHGYVLSTGYNGVAAGLPHCSEKEIHERDDELEADVCFPFACMGAFSSSGTDLDRCEAIHAEQNALLQCRDPHLVETCYTTTSPCVTCVKLLMNTSCRRIVFVDEYPQLAAKALWLKAGRLWEQAPMIEA